jgi:POT family proton-dependent oligopeptide transporter
MEKILNQTHNENTFIYSGSKLLERAAYYGFRGLMVLYLMSESIGMTGTEAYKVYTWFTFSLIISGIIGAVLGDLFIGNRKALSIGGILQILGFFCLFQPSLIFFYIGLGIITIGNGFYVPNMLAAFGKNYLDKTKLLDAGFMIYYAAIHIGSFVGILSVAYVGEIYGVNYGFAAAGLLMLIATVLLNFTKENKVVEFEKKEVTIQNRLFNTLLIILSVGLFWALYEVAAVKMYAFEFDFSQTTSFTLPDSFFMSINSYFVIGIAISAVAFWTVYHQHQTIKLAFGFVFATIGFGIFFLIPDSINEQNIFFYIIATFFIAIAEVCVAPIIQSILTEYINPKYLAIAFSFAFLPTRFFAFAFNFWNSSFTDSSTFALAFGVIGFGIVGLVLFGLVQFRKKENIANELF